MGQIHKKARSCVPSYWRGIDSDYGPWSRMMSVAVDIKASNSIYALADRNTANIDDRTTIRRNPNWRLQFATLCDILCLDDFLKNALLLYGGSYGLRSFFITLFCHCDERKRISDYKHRMIAILIDIAIKCQVLILLLAIVLYQFFPLKWARMKNSCILSYGGVHHISCCYNDNLFYHCTLTRWAATLKIIRDEEILEDFAEGSLFLLLHHAGWSLVVDMRWK